jgi:SAM-dependent methyltransferase
MSPMSSKSDIADWDRIAKDFAETAKDGPRFDYIIDVFDQLLGDVSGLEVLDLGCGHGWLSGRLQEAGAAVTGVDGSTELLRLAKDQFENVTFTQADLAEGLPGFDRKKFDVVISHTVLMDIPDIKPLLRDVSGALSTDGRFIFSLLHPCFWNQKSQIDPETGEWHKRVKGYLREEVLRVESFGGHNHYHRPVSYYTQALQESGMLIQSLLEPQHQPTKSHSEIPEDFITRFSLFLLIEAVKSETGSAPTN